MPLLGSRICTRGTKCEGVTIDSDARGGEETPLDCLPAGGERPKDVVGCKGLAGLSAGDVSVFVRGVRVLRAVPSDATCTERVCGPLKTDDAVLACELAEPTPLRRSPCIVSFSSPGCADIYGTTLSWTEPGGFDSSSRDLGVVAVS
jgi:hypothetical protein